MVSLKIKHLIKMGSNFNSSFLSFWVPNSPTKNSHKEKIVALSECRRMKAMSANRGPRLTEERTLTIGFLSFAAPLVHIKSSQKENIIALK